VVVGVMWCCGAVVGGIEVWLVWGKVDGREKIVEINMNNSKRNQYL
jgi:hypothetical protein